MQESIKDIHTLIKIQTTGDINSVEIVKRFIDNDQQCAVAKINGATIEFLYYEDLKFLESAEEQFRSELLYNLQHTLKENYIEPLISDNEATEEMVMWLNLYNWRNAERVL